MTVDSRPTVCLHVAAPLEVSNQPPSSCWIYYNDERQCYGYSSRAHERRHSVVLTLHLRVLDTLRLCRMVSFVLMPLTPMTCRLIVCEMNVNQSFSHSSMLRNGDILLTRLPCHIEMSCSVMKTKQVILQHRLNVFL